MVSSPIDWEQFLRTIEVASGSGTDLSRPFPSTNQVQTSHLPTDLYRSSPPVTSLRHRYEHTRASSSSPSLSFPALPASNGRLSGQDFFAQFTQSLNDDPFNATYPPSVNQAGPSTYQRSPPTLSTSHVTTDAARELAIRANIGRSENDTQPYFLPHRQSKS